MDCQLCKFCYRCSNKSHARHVERQPACGGKFKLMGTLTCAHETGSYTPCSSYRCGSICDLHCVADTYHGEDASNATSSRQGPLIAPRAMHARIVHGIKICVGPDARLRAALHLRRRSLAAHHTPCLSLVSPILARWLLLAASSNQANGPLSARATASCQSTCWATRLLDCPARQTAAAATCSPAKLQNDMAAGRVASGCVRRSLLADHNLHSQAQTGRDIHHSSGTQKAV